ncbi:hypothetical protein Tco_0830690, partial [Tanacetum coccineum]
MEIKKQKEVHGLNADMEYDPSNVDFVEWLASKFSNHKTMDWYTKNALWIYWIRGDDEVVLTDEELSDIEEENLSEEDKIAKILRIETDIFHFETPLWLEDSEVKDEALINKAILEGPKETRTGTINDDTIQTDQGCFDNHEPMEDNDDAIRDLDDYFIPNEGPYYVDKEEERSKERRCKFLGIPYVKPPTCKSKKFE